MRHGYLKCCLVWRVCPLLRFRLEFPFVAAYGGHSAVRRDVMGDDASTRSATPAEIVEMEHVVRDAMRAGAHGFSTSQIDLHQAHDGRPVPSNLAADDAL